MLGSGTQVHNRSETANRMHLRLNRTHHSRSLLPPSHITASHAKNHPKKWPYILLTRTPVGGFGSPRRNASISQAMTLRKLTLRHSYPFTDPYAPQNYQWHSLTNYAQPHPQAHLYYLLSSFTFSQ